MRIDKYLKLSRVIKRRTIAKDVLDIGLVKINGKTAKPATEVRSGDVLELTLGEKILTIRVTNVIENASKKNAGEMFEVISEDEKAV